MKQNFALYFMSRMASQTMVVLMLSWPGARLVAGSPPVIIPSTSFQHQSVALGQAISFTVTASGDLPLTFQWRLDGVDLAGQTDKNLSITNARPADEGDYTVVVANPVGHVASAPARLYVVPPATNMIKANFVDNTAARLPYFYHLPEDYSPARAYPLVVLLHGTPGDENTTPPFLAAYSFTRVFASYRQQATDPVLLVWPTRRPNENSWTDQYLRQVSGLIDKLRGDFNINTNRIYIGGASEGVHAVWDLVGMRPSFFAAALLGAGWAGSTKPALVKDLPIWVECAANDEGGQLGNTRALVTALRNAGGRPIYAEYLTGGHYDGAGMLLRTPAVVDWILAQRRGNPCTNAPLLCITNPAPDALFTTGASAVSLAGWADAADYPVMRVHWTNTTAGKGGLASGTNLWSAAGVPLLANKTNLIVVAGTTTSGSSGYGGSTTFNDTIAVFSTPLKANISHQPSSVVLTWTGGAPPFHIQHAPSLSSSDWAIIQSNAVPPLTLPLNGDSGFYRILGR
jgi:predicted esterase